ncbi:hypothetical protein M9H77_16879 [Catharanthus roseus]|uniref:Uncharacterized protein n=1 Tax=Catharanthus roseus TaxID=4058 RepID=A0ACC0B323_CATRO|nr:hypothetical protein M9H77_16879 [Catharanthus roseus]
MQKIWELILDIMQVLLHLKNRGYNSCGFKRSRRMFTFENLALEIGGEGWAILVLSVRRECSLSSHTARTWRTFTKVSNKSIVRQASHMLVDHTDPQCLSPFFESHGI